MAWPIITIYISKCAQMDPQQLPKTSKVYSKSKKCDIEKTLGVPPPLVARRLSRLILLQAEGDCLNPFTTATRNNRCIKLQLIVGLHHQINSIRLITMHFYWNCMQCPSFLNNGGICELVQPISLLIVFVFASI